MPPKSEYKGRKITDYTKNTEVVVNIRGEWKKALMKNDAVLDGKKLKMEVEYQDANGATHTEMVEVDGDAPRVIPENYFDFEDAEKGKVRVYNPEVAEDGSIEYTIDYDGTTYTGVSKDVIDLWKKSAEMSEKLRKLKQELGAQSARKHLQFIEKNQVAEKMIADIFALVREGKRIDSFDRIEIEKRQQTLSKLIDAADKEIKVLAHEIQSVDLDEDQSAAMEIKKILKDEIEQRKIKQQNKLLEEKNKKAEAVYHEEKKKWDAFQASGAARPPRGTPSQEPQLVVITAPDPLSADEEMRIKKAAYYDYLEHEPQLPEEKEFKKRVLQEVGQLRKKKAQKEIGSDAAELEKTGNTILDYKKPADKAAYLNSKYFTATMESLDQVLNAMEHDDSSIDTEQRFNSMRAKVHALIGEIPLQHNKKPEKGYEMVHDRLRDLLGNIQKNEENLKDELTAFQAGFFANSPQPPGPDELKVVSAAILDQHVVEIEELERALRLVQSEKELESYKKTKKKEVTTEDEKHVPVINIPEHLMRELLVDRASEVKVAVTTLFKNDLSEALQEQAAHEAFKDIFSDDAPDDTVLKKLKKYGIREWGQFKKMWDEKFAGTMVKTMHEMAKALVKKEVSASITLGDKAGKLWRTILGRAAVSGALVGGSALALTAILGSGGVGGVVVAAAGGAAGGWMKSKVHEKLGGKFQKKVTEKMEELEREKHDEVVERVVEHMLAGVTGAPVSKRKKKGVGSDELPSFSAALTQGLRDLTTEEQRLSDPSAREVEKLTGNARVLYEQILAHVDTQEPDEKVRNQLAQAVSRLNGNGDVKQIVADQKLDSKVGSALEKFFSAYSGKDGAAKSAGIGAIAGVAFFAGQELVRAGFGAGLGARAGYKIGEIAEYKAQEKESRAHVFADIKLLREYTKKQFERTAVDIHVRKQCQEALIRLKRLLHTSLGASRDELAVFGVVGREPVAKGKTGDTGWVDAAGRVVIDAHGRILNPELKFLVQDMRSAVNDAEEYGLLQEQDKDRQKLSTVLDQMKKKSEEIVKDQHAQGKKKWIKWAYAAAGAVLGGLAAWAPRKLYETAHGIGDGRTMIADYARNTKSNYEDVLLPVSSASALSVEKTGVETGTMDTSTPSMSRVDTVSDSATRNVVSPEFIAQGAAATTAGTSESVSIPRETVSAVVPENTPEKPQVFVGEIRKGEGVLHGANRAIEKAMESGRFKIEGNLDDTITDAELRAWKIKELKNMGFVFEKGKWGYPFTVHPGAEVVIRADEEGNAHLAIINEPKKITHHEFIKFKDVRGAVSADTDPEMLERARVNARLFEREMITASRPDALVHVGVKADPELSRTLIDDNGRVEGIVGAQARKDGGVSLELESGKTIGAFPELDPRLGTGMELDPSVPQWTLRPLEYAPGIPLPYEDVGGSGRLTESSLKVDAELQGKHKAFMTREEYEALSRTPVQKAPGQIVDKQPAVQEKPTAASAAEETKTGENKSEIKPNTEAASLSLKQKHEAFKTELNQIDKTIKENFNLIKNPDKVWPGIDSTIDDIKQSIGVNKDLDKLADGEQFGKIVKSFVHPDMKLLSTSFDAGAAHRFSAGNIEGAAMIAEGENDVGDTVSSMRLRVGEGSSAKEYLFSAPNGYKFATGPDGVVLVNIQTKQSTNFEFGPSDADLSEAELIVSVRQAGR